MLFTYLSEEITEGPADKGSAGLGSEGVLVQLLVVGGPAGNGTAAGDGGVAEEGTLLGLAEGGLGQGVLRRALVDRNRRGRLLDTEGRGGDEEGSDEDGGELHLGGVGVGTKQSESRVPKVRAEGNGSAGGLAIGRLLDARHRWLTPRAILLVQSDLVDRVRD